MTDKRLLTPTKLNLLRAADYIEMYGWYQGDLYDESQHSDNLYWVRTKLMPRACAMGALRMTSPSATVTDEAARMLARYLGQEDGDEDITGIAEWNDRDTTNKDMVVHALRGAALT
jgi:hypothetical protein